jgi:hypothetical protein
VNLPHDESLSAPSPEELAHAEENAPSADAAAPEHGASAHVSDAPWLARFSLFRLFRRPALAHRHVLGTVASSVALLVALIAPAFFAGLSLLGGNAPTSPAAAAALHKSNHNANQVDGSAAAHFENAASSGPLPGATAPPAPAPPSLASAPPLKPHEVFGFAPYWTLAQEGGFNVAGISTLAYFSLDLNADGSVVTSGPGWNGYQSQALADLVTRAHAAGDRVVLTVTDFDQTSLDLLTSSPTAPQTLANQLVWLVGNKNLDGVNLDFEGEGSGDQAGLTSLVSQVSSVVKAVNPHYQVTMDTYSSSAGDTSGFYNVPALAPEVDAFFVMAYDLNLAGTTSATSPLTSGLFSDQTAVDQYAKAVPPSKVILGLPFYGLDWPTSDGTLTAQAEGPSTPVSIGQVQASGHPIYWDATTGTGWTSYQVGGQWHETFFETPTSFYLGAELAQSRGLAGVGMWALGMDGNNPADLSALLGFGPAVKEGPAGPAATSLSPPTAPASPTSTTSTTTTPPATSTHPGSGTTTTTTPPSTSTTTSTTQPNPGPSPNPPNPQPPPTQPNPGPPTNPPNPFTYTGVWNTKPVQLTAVPAGTTPPQVTGRVAGQLTGFATSDPAAACLAAEPALTVYAVSGNPAEFLVTAATTADCTTAEFVFIVTGTVP